ncbi:putative zinc-binding metallopeptidase [Pantoea sp. 18069]|uniref:zinc-binding metallopeptidase family protein n=1 Tax=Pantoea sp. 18069 TaxID=2681415 RepID=UPI0013590D23|nr:putative zinc-binding peptidase [Pantoea sp. 18069]
MQVFNCDQCGHLVFFDSVQCLHCGATLAFLPQTLEMVAMQPLDNGWWQRASPRGAAKPELYRFCRNRTLYDTCNFTVAGGDAHAQCVSCRQTRWLPDLSDLSNLRRWKQIEAAKRHLYYCLARLGLQPGPGERAPQYDLLEEVPGQPPVMTGHANGTITLNVAEADDEERARRRMSLNEPYRTLIGHLRHECGHFFWDLLVRDSEHLEQFRALFGDERQDYGQALQNYYARQDKLTGWQEHFISGYAQSHPWEDWAETWAHYLHMVDLLETGASYQTHVTVPAPSEHHDQQVQDPFGTMRPDFHAMLKQWVPLTLLLNSLNRSLGHQDAYPFALSAGARRKLMWVHELLQQHRLQRQQPPSESLPPAQ